MIVNKTEADWQAEDDAQTLARAEQIKEDKARLTAAQQAAKRLLKEEEERTRGMRKVARRKEAKRPTFPARSKSAPKRKQPTTPIGKVKALTINGL